MKKLNLYKVIPYQHTRTSSYARRQHSVLTRNIAAERASKINLDILPQVDSIGVGFKGPSPRELRSVVAESGHKYPQYQIEDCKVFQHRLPRMITVMQDRL